MECMWMCSQARRLIHATAYEWECSTMKNKWIGLIIQSLDGQYLRRFLYFFGLEIHLQMIPSSFNQMTLSKKNDENLLYSNVIYIPCCNSMSTMNIYCTLF
jgi:hypothetical protein